MSSPPAADPTDAGRTPAGQTAASTATASPTAASPTTASAVWEVFVRPRRGLSHQHVGSVHAADAELALRRARDLYTRRGEGVSIWVVPGGAISASCPDEKDPYFAPAADKAYRHPTFYQLPEGVKNL